MVAESTTLLDRAFGRIGRALRDVAGTARVRLTGELRPDLPEDDAERLRRQIDACIEGRGGQVSARVQAADLGRVYIGLAPTGRANFLTILANDYGVDRAALAGAIAALGAVADETARLGAEENLRAALIPPRVKLLTHFNGLPQGVKFLVDLRADLLALARRDPVSRALDNDLRSLLVGWFDVGFLDLARITWNASAALLERLIAYEAVHQIRSWTDLKNRLDSDRRCYAFFHPRMPDEPLIFVEVALVSGIADSIQTLLDESAPAMEPFAADTAVFYSISNCQKGLSGVSFGNFLIKRVVDALSRDLPRLRTFATLSPMPGFRAWLDGQIEADELDLLSRDERRTIEEAAGEPKGSAALIALLARPDWAKNPELAEVLKQPLLRLGARYLLTAKAGHGTRDRVCHFHLSNGARIERLNWLADVSPVGLGQSAGLMVNYRYKLDEIEANHETYAAGGKIVATGAVRRLIKG